MLRHVRTTLAAVAAMAGACALQAPAQAADKLVIGFPNSPLTVQFAYFAFGEELGFFKEEGLQPEYSLVTGSGVLLPQVATGQVHVGYANPDFVVIAAAKNEPLPVTFVMNWARSHGFEFVVPEKSPAKELADLKGKKLGIGALTWGNIPLTRAMLASAGIKWNKDIEAMPVGVGPAAWRRLETGEVDALNLFVSQHGAMELAGIKIRRLPLPEKYRAIFSNGWVASNDVIAKNPKLIAGFGRALTKSWLACKANPEGCVKAHWKHYPAEAPAAGKEAVQLAADAKRVMFDAKFVDDFAPGAPHVYGGYPTEIWKRLIDVMHAEGQITRNDLDVTRLFSNAFVDDFNRFDVKAVEKAAKEAK